LAHFPFSEWLGSRPQAEWKQSFRPQPVLEPSPYPVISLLSRITRFHARRADTHPRILPVPFSQPVFLQIFLWPAFHCFTYLGPSRVGVRTSGTGYEPFKFPPDHVFPDSFYLSFRLFFFCLSHTLPYLVPDTEHPFGGGPGGGYLQTSVPCFNF